MNKTIIAILSPVFLFFGCSDKTTGSIEKNVEKIDSLDLRQISESMEKSRVAWNIGDFEGYMDVYLKSDSLVFMGIKGITKGWQNTLAKYKKGYPDAASRGYLNYEYHIIRPLGKEHILLIGKFILKHDKSENQEGFFSLIWKKVDGEWKIIMDHT